MYKQDGRTGFRRPRRRSTIPSNNRTLELPAWRATTQGPHSPPSTSSGHTSGACQNARAAPAVRQWPAGRLVKAPQQPLQAVGRRGGGGGGGVCVRGKRGGCERSTHYLLEQSVSHYLREQSAHYLRRPPCGGSWRDAWRRRGSNRSGQRGGAGVWGGGLRAGGAQRMREKRRLQRLAVARVWAGARGTYIGSTVSRGHGAGAVPEESGPGGRASELGARSRVPANVRNSIN